jgi:hypothetical protein
MAEADGLAGSGASGGVDARAVVASAPADRVLAMQSWILSRGGRQTVGGNRARRWTATQQPLIASLPSLLPQSYFDYSRPGKEMRKYLTEQEMKQGNTLQTENR